MIGETRRARVGRGLDFDCDLVSSIDSEREQANLSSALRLFVVNHGVICAAHSVPMDASQTR
jgi:hypothetical protein